MCHYFFPAVTCTEKMYQSASFEDKEINKEEDRRPLEQESFEREPVSVGKPSQKQILYAGVACVIVCVIVGIIALSVSLGGALPEAPKTPLEQKSGK